MFYLGHNNTCVRSFMYSPLLLTVSLISDHEFKTYQIFIRMGFYRCVETLILPADQSKSALSWNNTHFSTTISYHV